MPDKDFAFEEAPLPAEGCAACPLSRIPADVWVRVLRPPFRKRHPLLFWGCILALLAVCLFLAHSAGRGRSFASGPCLARVSLTGPIMDVRAHLDWLRELERNEDVRGVLLRVDSPGGGAAASQELYQALRSLAATKPLAVSMGSVAASGGLMVSMAGQRVFANASTVTGSIGVRMDIPQLQGLLEKIGVGQETLTTAPYKDAGSYLRALTPEQRAYFQGVLDDMHRQFVDIVAQGRRMEPARAAALADGRIFTGRAALEQGLVDELGGEDAALAWLAKTCEVPADRKLLTRPKDEGWLPRGLKALLDLAPAEVRGLAGRGSPAFLYQW